MRIPEELRAQGGGQDPAAIIARIPYARFLGIELERRGDELTTVLPYSEQLIGNAQLPALHGGVIGAFLEITCVAQLLLETELERLPKTIDIGIDYLRSGRPTACYGRAWVNRQGRRVANLGAEVWQEERQRPIAAAHGHFLLQRA